MNPRIAIVRAEVDMNLHLAREEMDRKVQEERHIMDNKLDQERSDMDLKLQIQRAAMDNTLLTSDKMIKQQRDDIDQKIKEECDNLDAKLKHERQAMDRQIVFERVEIDSGIMHARVELDKKLELERQLVDFQIMEEHKPITDMVEKEIVPPQVDQEHKLNTDMDMVPNDMKLEHMIQEEDLIMEFRVYVAGHEFLYDPQGKISLPYIFRFMEHEAEIVSWDNLLNHMGDVEVGLRTNCDLYYLKPSSEAPEGLVRMFGSEEMDALLQDHLGTKLCHLYLVDYGYFINSDGMDGSD